MFVKKNQQENKPKINKKPIMKSKFVASKIKLAYDKAKYKD